MVVSGFEPLDVLQGVQLLLRQLAEGRSEVENQYQRVVRDEGNPLALEAIAETMELRTTFEWRGLGFISQSALGSAPNTRTGTPRSATSSPASGSPTRRPASAARC